MIHTVTTGATTTANTTTMPTPRGFLSAPRRPKDAALFRYFAPRLTKSGQRERRKNEFEEESGGRQGRREGTEVRKLAARGCAPRRGAKSVRPHDVVPLHGPARGWAKGVAFASRPDFSCMPRAHAFSLGGCWNRKNTCRLWWPRHTHTYCTCARTRARARARQ